MLRPTSLSFPKKYLDNLHDKNEKILVADKLLASFTSQAYHLGTLESVLDSTGHGEGVPAKYQLLEDLGKG